MSKSTPDAGTPDAVGLGAAQAAQKAVAPDTVILFGSRARGDHRPDSDVDLLVIHDRHTNAVIAAGRANRAVKAYFKAHPPRIGIDVVTIEREQFNYACRARNHVAGQALRDGIVMSGEKPGGQSSCDDEYPVNWPDTKERLQATYRHLGTFEREFIHPDGEPEMYGFHAQQAVENALKGWLSAADIEYRRVHDLEEFAEKIFDDPDESLTLAAAQLKLLLDYTRFTDPGHPRQSANWLTRYAVQYRYRGAAFRMDDLEKSRFRQEIILAVETFVNRAHELSGTGHSDLA